MLSTSEAIGLILSGQTDADSPVNELLMSAMRKNFEQMLLKTYYTGVSGTLTSTPTTAVCTNTGAGMTIDAHIGRTVVFVTGAAAGNMYTIDDNDATTFTLTGDDPGGDGVVSGDEYMIFYDLINYSSGHTHDNINAASVVLADSQVSQAKLKTTTGSASVLVTATGTKFYAGCPGGEYAFRGLVRSNYPGYIGFDGYITPGIGGSYGALYAAFSATDVTVQPTGYIQERYVQSSGEVHWIFYLKNRETGIIEKGWQAPDHCCFGNGDDPDLVQHPFGDYDQDKYELIVVNPPLDFVKQLKRQAGKSGEILEILSNEYEIDELSSPAWPTKAVTVGLPSRWEDAWMTNQPVQTIKSVIPMPKQAVTRVFKKKNNIRSIEQ